jgi:hypothetical protein
MALHSTVADAEMPHGDARITGNAIEVTDQAKVDEVMAAAGQPAPPGPMHLFRIDVTELMLVWVDGDQLVVESWSKGAGVRRTQRS